LAGLFPGMFVGAFIMLAWVICTGRHRKANRNSGTSSTYTRKTMVISDPIPMASGGIRTDFLRKTTDRAKSMFSTKSPPSPKFATSHWKMPTPPVPNNIPPGLSGIPVTPERRLPQDSDTESIRVYSPPNGAAQPSVPPNIAPLRGMAAQRYPAGNNNMGSPFQTPPNTNPVANRVSSVRGNERGVSTYSSVSALSSRSRDGEVLSPARYEGGGYTQNLPGPASREPGRPNTTFTEMLHEAGFPDPYRVEDTPAVPKLPKGYGRGR
jgi:hypothetical protein